MHLSIVGKLLSVVSYQQIIVWVKGFRVQYVVHLHTLSVKCLIQSKVTNTHVLQKGVCMVQWGTFACPPPLHKYFSIFLPVYGHHKNNI